MEVLKLISVSPLMALNPLGGTSEEYCRLFSSRGLLKSCDHHDPEPASSQYVQERIDFTKVKRGESVYVCVTAIPFFIQHQFPLIPEPFVLVTGDGDEVVPFDQFKEVFDILVFLSNPKLLHWFAVNAVIDHPKLTRIPYGLDYHTCQRPGTWGPVMTALGQEELLMRIRDGAKPFWERRCASEVPPSDETTARDARRAPLAYWNIFATDGRRFAWDRTDASAKIPAECLWREVAPVPREETWRRQTEFAFVASPHSNGLDCIRTWEALQFGCIPIVKTSPIDKVYDGLPVLIVKAWEDVTPALLERVIAEFKEREWDTQRLTLKYWVERIRTAGTM
jgi:hypothetical protein